MLARENDQEPENVMIQAAIAQHTRARLKPLEARKKGRDCVLANDC